MKSAVTLNKTEIINKPIDLSEHQNEEIEQLARNNYLFQNKVLRFDLITGDYLWTDKVNQNIKNN